MKKKKGFKTKFFLKIDDYLIYLKKIIDETKNEKLINDGEKIIENYQLESSNILLKRKIVDLNKISLGFLFNLKKKKKGFDDENDDIIYKEIKKKKIN
jgi:hypothetical protein